MKSVRALILTGFGINCEEEMAAAYELAGAESVIVHLNDILVEGFNIHDFNILNFPGGFSFGDDIASGRVLANKIKYKRLSGGKTFLDEIKKFVADKKYIFGVCNGFQVLVKLGLLPGLSGFQDATLTTNNSAKFEDRWCNISVNRPDSTPFLKGIQRLYLPVRHGEGKLVFRDKDTLNEVINQKLDVMRYSDEMGNQTDLYPFNPNGSQENLAALTDKSGQVFGMMPHPEAALSIYNDPRWGEKIRLNPQIDKDGDGMKIFTNIVSHIKENN
jgi:phosphoribosylformylglycinamidine synthase I